MSVTKLLSGVALNLLDNVAAGTVTSNPFALLSAPSMITWQCVYDVAPGSITVQLQASNDNVNWGTIDTSTATASGNARTTYCASPFIRINVSAIVGGSHITVSVAAKPMNNPKVFGFGVQVLATQPFSVGNGADLTEDTIFSATIPANTFIQAGRVIRLRAWGTTANNGDTKTLKVKFGADTFTAFSGVVTALGWYAEYTIQRTNVISNQSRVGRGEFGSSQSTTVAATIGLPETADIAVSITAQASVANANDIVVFGAILDTVGA